MFTTNLFAWYRHLASRSRAMDVELKIPRSIAYVCTHPVTDEDHMCQTYGGPLEAKTMTYIWHSRGRDCNTATKYHRVTSALRVLRHDYQASLHFAALGNYSNCFYMSLIYVQTVFWDRIQVQHTSSHLGSTIYQNLSSAQCHLHCVVGRQVLGCIWFRSSLSHKQLIFDVVPGHWKFYIAGKLYTQ